MNGETAYHTALGSADMQTKVGMKDNGETDNLMVKELSKILMVVNIKVHGLMAKLMGLE